MTRNSLGVEAVEPKEWFADVRRLESIVVGHAGRAATRLHRSRNE